jgi:hypothetical protein
MRAKEDFIGEEYRVDRIEQQGFPDQGHKIRDGADEKYGSYSVPRSTLKQHQFVGIVLRLGRRLFRIEGQWIRL